MTDNYSALVFPSDGIGTGLADLPNVAPQTNNYLNKKLKQVLHIDNVFGKKANNSDIVHDVDICIKELPKNS